MTPDEAVFILNKIESDFETRRDFIELINKLEYDIENENNLFLYYLTRKIYSTDDKYNNLLEFEQQNEDLNVNVSTIDRYCIEEENDEYSDEPYDYKKDKELSVFEKQCIEKFIDYISPKNETTLIFEITNFVLENVSELYNGYHPSLYKQAKDLYRNQFGEVRIQVLPYNVWVKLRNAQNKADNEVKNKILLYQETQYSKWANEFIEYSKTINLKTNKTNIQNFLKLKKIRGNKLIGDILLDLIIKQNEK